MTPDELRTMPRGQFVVMKTGVHPMIVHLKLFFDWGIRFGDAYRLEEHGNRPVVYASSEEIRERILETYHPEWIHAEVPAPQAAPRPAHRTTNPAVEIVPLPEQTDGPEAAPVRLTEVMQSEQT